MKRLDPENNVFGLYHSQSKTGVLNDQECVVLF